MGSLLQGADVGSVVSSQVTATLPRVSHEAPAAVLLVDLDARAVVYVNSIAEHMAPGVQLPAPVEAWSDAAVLRDLDGAELSETAHPLSLVARSQPVAGQAVSAARPTELGRTREPLWVVALPMADAPRLEGHALVVFLPLRDRDSAQAAAAAAQAQAELRDRAVLATGMAFTVADAQAEDLPLVWVNPAFTATTGYSFDEAVGRNCRFLQGSATDPATATAMREALQAAQAVTTTVLNYRKDGTAFWNQVAMSPVHGPDGALTHFVGIQTDVTARVAADAERDQALVAEREAREEAERARREAERARRDAEQAHQRLALLAEATSLLASSLDVDESLDRLSRLVVPLLADWMLVVTRSGDGGIGEVRARHRDGHEELMAEYAQALARAATPDSILFEVLEGGAPQLITDYSSPRWRERRTLWASDSRLLETTDALGAGSVLLVPLPGRNQVDGVMVLVRRPGSPAHSEQDMGVAVDLGRRAGLIVDNARLYQNEHRIAETLQRSLLPELPRIPGLRAAARYRASESGAAVGGDFYELMNLPDGAIGVAVGDVVGHDVLAAAAMGHLRGLLRACAWDTQAQVADDAPAAHHRDPADVLDRVDRLMQGLGITTLATVAYARLQAAGDGSWLLRSCSAGHPPLLVRHPDGAVELLDDANGIMLGVTPLERPTIGRTLAAGTTVLAYTDGLVERRGESLAVGLRRLRAAVASGPEDVEDLCDHLLTALGDSEDDVAILAVRL